MGISFGASQHEMLYWVVGQALSTPTCANCTPVRLWRSARPKIIGRLQKICFYLGLLLTWFDETTQFGQFHEVAVEIVRIAVPAEARVFHTGRRMESPECRPTWNTKRPYHIVRLSSRAHPDACI